MQNRRLREGTEDGNAKFKTEMQNRRLKHRTKDRNAKLKTEYAEPKAETQN